MEIYLKSPKNSVDATAEYDTTSGTVVVKAGSLLAKELSSAPTFRSRTSMQKKREGVVLNGVLTQDMLFTSLSTSATFVVGSNRDGWITWKDIHGKTMAELFKKD